MVIIVSMNFRDVVEVDEVIKDVSNRLSIVQPIVNYDGCYILIKLSIYKNILILFRPSSEKFIKGSRPDYYLTDSCEVEKYYMGCHGIKKLSNFTELITVVLQQCMMDDKREMSNKPVNISTTRITGAALMPDGSIEMKIKY